MSQLTGNLDRYSLGEQLGAPGGYGVAYSAVREDGQPCVVKLIYGFRNPSPADLARLEVMLARLRTVDSPNVVPIIDAGVDHALGGELPWIAMPHIDGARSLRDVIAQHPGPMGPAAAARFGRDIAAGLADLHAVQVLHRDLKPGNVLIGADGRARLIDFDLVKIADVITRTPRAHEPLGTEAFMAPEQRLGIARPRGDLWALGLIIVELLTGRQPVLAARRGLDGCRRAALTARLVGDDVPEPWRELCMSLLRKVPVARPASAQAVVGWFDDPATARLSPPALDQAPSWRWSLVSGVDVDAAEWAASLGAQAKAWDASVPASGSARRLRAAAARAGAQLTLDPQAPQVGQLALTDLASPMDGLTDLEQAAIKALREQAESPADAARLPTVDLGDGLDEAIAALRAGLRHRAVAAGKPVIATIACRTGALTSPGLALEIAAALTALRPDGWRLLIEGLDPGCGVGALGGAMEMASALAHSADTWVRAGGLARWPLATISGVSVLYRSGRGLWTRPGGGGGGWVPERVEIDALAGPVRRDFAERIEALRPDLLACGCPVCLSSGGRLPAAGTPTVVHNIYVAGGQLDALAGRSPRERINLAVDRLQRAALARESVAAAIDWHGELDDVHAAMSTINGASRPVTLLTHA